MVVAIAALVLLTGAVAMGAEESRLDALEKRLDAQQAIIERHR